MDEQAYFEQFVGDSVIDEPDISEIGTIRRITFKPSELKWDWQTYRPTDGIKVYMDRNTGKITYSDDNE